MPDGNIDPNTEAGFYESLAKSAGIEIDPAALLSEGLQDTSIEAGLEVPESAQQPRGEGGRFAPKEPVAAEPETPAEEAAPPSEGEEDDPLAALIEQHGGDAKAALAAVAAERDNAQSLIGKQGQELGELRAAQAAREAAREEVERLVPQTPAQPTALVTEAQLREAIEAGEDPAQQAVGVMSWVIDNAPDMVEDVERIWGEFDPFAALAFRQDRLRFEAEKEAAEKQPPANDDTATWVQTKRTQEDIGVALQAARQGITDEEWEGLKPLVLEELNAAPQYEKDAINTGDVKTKAEAFGYIVARARGKVTSEATKTAAEQAAAEALGAKQAATVVHAGAERRDEPAGTGGEEESVSKKLQRALLETETTSVAEGLTYGHNQPGLAGQVR